MKDANLSNSYLDNKNAFYLAAIKIVGVTLLIGYGNVFCGPLVYFSVRAAQRGSDFQALDFADFPSSSASHNFNFPRFCFS